MYGSRMFSVVRSDAVRFYELTAQGFSHVISGWIAIPYVRLRGGLLAKDSCLASCEIRIEVFALNSHIWKVSHIR